MLHCRAGIDNSSRKSCLPDVLSSMSPGVSLFFTSSPVSPAGSVWICVDDRGWRGERDPEGSSSVEKDASCWRIVPVVTSLHFPSSLSSYFLSCYFGVLVFQLSVNLVSFPIFISLEFLSLSMSLSFFSVLSHFSIFSCPNNILVS